MERRERFRPVLAVAAVLAMPGCGAAAEQPAAPPPSATTVRVEYDPDGRGPSRRHRASLHCPSASHPEPCRRLVTLPASVFEPVARDRVCTLIYGGPQVGRIRGFVNGRRVDARFTRRNGCEIARYARVEPILRLAAESQK